MNLYRIFSQILNMSMTASVVILFLILVRIFMRKIPKIYSYVLWSVVLFRLLCPVSISSDFALLGILDARFVSSGNITSTVQYVPSDIVNVDNLADNLPVIEGKEENDTGLRQYQETVAADSAENLSKIASYIWIIGMAVMSGYSVFSYYKLKKRLVGAIHVRDHIYMADHISSPFVLGIFRPRIYLLSTLEENEQKYMILHEQQHIHRRDHIVKILSYVSLCIHWFNPLVWIAFVLSTKDMEMSCDEAVVRKMGEEIRADYSASLLNFSTGQRLVLGMPLAFGEGDTKGRIKNLARWKRPAVGVSVAAVLLCVLIIWVSVSNPDRKETQAAEPFGYNYEPDEVTVMETFEKKYAIDSYDEWIWNTYYKMSDGTWRVDIENQEDGTVETFSYKYRIVLHGRMPNAAVESNYILLSNLLDITFKQTYMASGFSSNMDDYFTKEEAVFVASWLGDLENNHPQRDDDTIYIIEASNDWGIEFMASNVTPTGLTIECAQSGGNSSGELQTGSYYVVDRKTEEGWISVDYIIEDVGWNAEAWLIPMDETVKWETDWEWLYGSLPAGQYRIGKEIMDFRGTGDYDIAMVYAEFEIEN